MSAMKRAQHTKAVLVPLAAVPCRMRWPSWRAGGICDGNVEPDRAAARVSQAKKERNVKKRLMVERISGDCFWPSADVPDAALDVRSQE